MYIVNQEFAFADELIIERDDSIDLDDMLILRRRHKISKTP